MKAFNAYPTQHLTIDDLIVNRKVAQRLPPAVAFRYHALPIAKDNDHITVAMANPCDMIAREAIAVSLGMQPYVVQGNQAMIDQQLAEIWPDKAHQPILNILIYHQDSPIADEIKDYARYLGNLLNGQLSYFQLGDNDNETAGFSELVDEANCNQDLVIFGEPDQSLVKRILSGPAGIKAAERLSTSVLVARQPRWPLKKILLVTRGYETDNTAVDWLVRLAQPSHAITIVLALVPPSPAMYQRAATYMPHGLVDWLATDTPLGHQVRQIAHQLTNWEVDGRLHFRQGSPSQQIQRELAEEDYDLIVIAADPNDWWLRRLLGEVVNPLLHKADRPVLIAKPTIS
ncbi:MAG: universal stress protein [Anaerolineae bacterium]|nr:universal stress protein [Anaerolineae bacterium]